jgi:hypothetical protein
MFSFYRAGNNNYSTSGSINEIKQAVDSNEFCPNPDGPAIAERLQMKGARNTEANRWRHHSYFLSQLETSNKCLLAYLKILQPILHGIIVFSAALFQC